MGTKEVTVERSLKGCPKPAQGRGGRASRLQRRAEALQGPRATAKAECGLAWRPRPDSTPTAVRLCVTQPFSKPVHIRASVEPLVLAPGEATWPCPRGCHCASLTWVLIFGWPLRSVCEPHNGFGLGAMHRFHPKCWIPQCDYPFISLL